MVLDSKIQHRKSFYLDNITIINITKHNFAESFIIFVLLVAFLHVVNCQAELTYGEQIAAAYKVYKEYEFIWTDILQNIKNGNLQLENGIFVKNIIENFKNTTNLWTMCACITRMQLVCEKAWYEINFPEFKNS